jgi:transcriptional regulator with XRE-family HTH domain
MRLSDILQRIESRLVALGLSASEASKLAGKPGVIRNIRRGAKDRGGNRQGVTTTTLAALAPVLQTTESWLLTGQGASGEEIAAEAGSSRDRLMQAMAERGIDSAPALAGTCGLAESTARWYINGTRSLPLDVCMKIGQALGVSGTWIFHGNGPREAERTATPSELVFGVVEEAFLLTGIPTQIAREVAGVIQLILALPPRAPPGMSQQDALRRLVRIHLTDVLGPGAS